MVRLKDITQLSNNNAESVHPLYATFCSLLFAHTDYTLFVKLPCHLCHTYPSPSTFLATFVFARFQLQVPTTNQKVEL